MVLKNNNINRTQAFLIEIKIWNWFRVGKIKERKKERKRYINLYGGNRAAGGPKKGKYWLGRIEDEINREERKSLQRFAFVHEADRSAGVATSNEVKSFSYERPT
jgi:hypothetical protein